MVLKKKAIANFILLSISILLLLLLGVFQKELFDKIADIVGNKIWPTIIAVLTFFGFVVGGVVKNPPKSFYKFLDNTLVLIACIELFLFLIGISLYAYFDSSLGRVELQLASGKKDIHVNAIMIHNSDTTYIQIPKTLSDLKPGNYIFKIIDRDYSADSQRVLLNRGSNETVVLKDQINRKIIVNSNPDNAEIWIDGSLKSHTPDTLLNLQKDEIKLELKLAGYQSYSHSVNLSGKSIVNLGTINLLRLFNVKIICQFNETEFKYNGKDYIGSQKNILMPSGRNEILYKTNSNGYQLKTVNINMNKTIIIP